MKLRRPKSWLTFAKRWAPFLAGGLALQLNLSGCDSEVRTTVLDGLSSSMTTLFSAVIEAFFQSLQDAGSSSTTQSVVQAVVDNLHGWLA
jgi:hypothetical protein